jgi:aryl-alcohol dehydrogenase-like predicted oxidoreductase
VLRRRLGKSGLEVSALGMGCWAIGGPWTYAQPGEEPFAAGWGKIDDDESIRAIHAGLDTGINFFDTAANYGTGHSERILGKALKGVRDEVVIATKFGHVVNEEEKYVYRDREKTLGNVRGDIENSLSRLDTDYVDVYQLHDSGYDPEGALEVRARLEDLVQEGKIRWYGWSTDDPDRARVFADGDHCTSIQFSLNVLYDNEAMRQLCAEFDLAGINKDPLRRGILTGKFSRESIFPEDDVRTGTDFTRGRYARILDAVDALRELLTADGRSMAQGALAYIWGLDERMVPIPGFKTVKQVRDNAAAMDFGPMRKEEVHQAREIVGRIELDIG